MPNTMAHLGLQSLATRVAIPQADLKWVYLGCIVPDVPWILQRFMMSVSPSAWLFDLRLFAIIQSSLLFCLCLSGALAVWSTRPWKTFIILAFGSLLHLLLDATQTKWGNGVHLFAPFSWDLLNFGWYWPREVPTVILSLLGFIFMAYAWWKVAIVGYDLRIPKIPTLSLGLLCLVIYFTLPPLLFSGPIAADNHSIETLKEKDLRPGRRVEIDRQPYLNGSQGDVIVTFSGEEIALTRMTHMAPGNVSLKGIFVDTDTIRVEEVHSHFGSFRNLPTFLGLGWICFIWIIALRQKSILNPKP